MCAEETQRYWVAVQSEGDWNIDVESLRQAALATLIREGAPSVEVAVVVSDDTALRELNRRFRGVDATTDVLAFPNETKGPFVGVGGQPYYLGDVIVSYPRAEEQALEGGHSLSAELQLLVIHGMLHLLGYGDQTRAERIIMWEAQREIVEALGVQVEMPD